MLVTTIKGASPVIGGNVAHVHAKAVTAKKSTKVDTSMAKAMAADDKRTDAQRIRDLIADLNKCKVQREAKGIRAMLRRIDADWRETYASQREARKASPAPAAATKKK